MNEPSFSLGTFNLKDFFDHDGPLFQERVRLLGEQIKRANLDAVALQEVGSETALNALAEFVGGAGMHMSIGTSDKRGIRNALVSRLPFAEVVIHTRESLPFPSFFVDDAPPFANRIPLRRGVVHGTFESPLGRIHVLTAHFKSKLGVFLKDAEGNDILPTSSREYAEAMLRSLVSRGAEALFVRDLVDQIRQRDPSAHVCVVGDLNDTIDSLPVRIVRGFGPNELRSCTARIEESARFSALFGAKKEQIDHLLVSSELFERTFEAHIDNAELRDHGPFRTDAPPTIDSDHALVYARFR